MIEKITRKMRLFFPFLLLFLFTNISWANNNVTDSLLNLMNTTPDSEKIEVYKDLVNKAINKTILSVHELEGKILEDAMEVLGRDSAILWHFNLRGILAEKLRGYGHSGLAIPIFDKMKITADSISEIKGKLHWTLPKWHYYLGNFYRMQGEGDRVVELLTKGLELNKEVKDIRVEKALHHCLALHYSWVRSEEDTTEKAKKHFAFLDSLIQNPIFTVKEKLNVVRSRAYFHYNVEGEYEIAHDLMNQVMDSIHLFSHNAQHRLIIDYSSLLTDMGKEEKALSLLEEYLPQIKEANRTELLGAFYEEYIDALIMLGRYEEAKEYNEELRSIYITMEFNRRNEAVQEWQAKYEATEKEAKIQLLEQQKINSQSRITIISMIALLGIGLLSFFLYRNKNKQKQLALDLERDRQVAEKDRQIAENRDRLFSSITHDIRTPLALMLAPLERAENHSSNEAVKSDINLARRNGKRLMELFNQILDWNKAEAKALVLNPQVGQLDITFSSLCERFQQQAVEKGVKFTNEINMPKGQFLLDYDKMDKILSNLIGNAIKFCEVGQGVQLEADFEKRGNDYSLLLKVSDQGPGIGNEEQKNLFNRYVQGEQGKLKGGTGLGLALVKELVEMMKGDIELQSELGKGTTFKVNLPMKMAEDLPVVPLQNQEYQPTPTDIDSEKPLILIVEDEPELLEFLRSALVNDYEVEIANSTSVGLNLAISRIPEVIISDWTLPDNTGGWLCQQISKNELTAHIPVMILTAHNSDTNQKMAFDSGAVAWMNKPFQLDVLRRQLSTILMQQKRAQNLWAKKTPTETISDVEEEQVETISPFIEKVIHVIGENYSDENYSVEKMAEMLYLSRVQLFRKVKSITGTTPSKMINEYRLKKARQLLQQPGATVSEVSYEVGFSDPSYFGKVYKQYFQVSPSQDLASGNN